MDIEQGQASAPIPTTRRERTIVRTSSLGIVANVLLAALKAVVGVVSNSIAITLDAVNNLSDALSSVITIVGTKLAGRAPDKRHPMGYGRIEYLTAMVISVIVLYAGITSGVESVRKIISPEVPDYSAAALAVVAAGVVAKVLLGRHVQSVGKRVNADSLVASGQDALSDAVLSASTLGAAVIYLIWGLSLEAWVGTAISAFIVKAGLGMLWRTLSQILGERVSPKLAERVKGIVAEEDGVLGVYDLFLNSYGPECRVGSVHVEVADTTSAEEIDELSRRVAERVFTHTDGQVVLAAVGIYSRNTGEDVSDMRERVRRIAVAHDHVLQFHGFHVNEARRLLEFDVIIAFEAADREGEYQQIVREVEEAFPDYAVRATLDSDITD
ncbi:MAG: cation diffusion facilitator family transporter [Tractidigestivibacter sp.]|uniref:cation diffusion facilitator family transporter n=1 Tax=Tractidigestivibacter sp. TaxID=2847320 RepID=UPI002A802ADA|nr:cation diffusion facilitator family transporter [Tractidigestivibacter sp.]MDD7583593.1 cation diffusion facilitator family transporter [Coriobacteriaceae bacterium]MDY4534919.1 cation diffusion facilitator family transporter [Tractidigestivibacter sp.]